MTNNTPKQRGAVTVLGIETSCDETGIAVVRASLDAGKPSFDIRSNVIASQIDVHKEFGGVVPNLAAREHVKALPLVLKKALMKAKIQGAGRTTQEDIDLIAVTEGPGLIPCLLTGVHFARTLAWQWNLPVIGVDHMEGHLYSPLIDVNGEESKNTRNKKQTLFPAIALIVSGGHTMLVLVRDIGDHEVLGETVDDAAGEAFDKVARMLGLGYPGGPALSAAANNGDSNAFDFPRPMLDSDDYRFSFSGLKTAVLYTLRDIAQRDPNNPNTPELSGENSRQHHSGHSDAFVISDRTVADVAASFEQAAVDVLVTKTIRAAQEYNAKSVWLAGGVAANARLRRELKQENKKEQRDVLVPSMQLSTDNGAMIAAAGALQWMLTQPNGDWHTPEARTLHRLEPWK